MSKMSKEIFPGNNVSASTSLAHFGKINTTTTTNTDKDDSTLLKPKSEI